MNVASTIGTALPAVVALMGLICYAEDALSAEQQELIADFHQTIPTLRDSMNRASTALQASTDSASADAAAAAITAVSQAEEAVKAAAGKLTEAGLGVSRLYSEGDLAKAVSSLPIAAYNADIQSALAAGCHGSVKLYLAITEDTRPYTAEQLQAELSEQERADLKEIEQVFGAMKEVCPNSHWRPLEDEFVRRFDASLPAAERLQQRPLTAMLLHRLLEQYTVELYTLCNHNFHNNGDMEDRFVLHPQNYIGQWYSQRALSGYFYGHADSLDRNSATPRGKAIWDAAAPKLTELRRKYDLGPGDGRTRETAFDIPADIKPADYKKFINDVTRELFGERALHSELLWSSVGTNGRRVVHGLILVGRPGNRNRNNDSNIIMPCYFNLERKENNP